MKNPVADILLRYYQHIELSETELTTLSSWLNESEHNEDLFDDLSNRYKWFKEMKTSGPPDDDAVYTKIKERLHKITDLKG